MITISSVALLAVVIFVFLSLQIVKKPAPGTEVVDSIAERLISPEIGTLIDSTEAEIESEVVEIESQPTIGDRNLVEIFGRVTDLEQRPIENALVIDEQNFFSTRSDANGNYKLTLDLPWNHSRTLYFLRNGYAHQRILLSKNEPSVLRLDIALEDAIDSVGLSGWISNEIGIGLAEARIELASRNKKGAGNFNLAAYSDDNGYFFFEGVPVGEDYKLTANLSPNYLVYLNDKFSENHNQQTINIEIESLKFVTINGMFISSESAPVADFEVYITNISTAIHNRKIVSDSSGFFTLDKFPLGNVSMSTRASEYFKISGLTLTEENHSNLTLVIDTGNHYLTGWVTDEYGVAIEKAMVTLHASIKEGPVESFSYRSQTTDSAGRFHFAQVGSIQHQISVYATGYDKAEIDHRFEAQSDEVFIRLTRPY